MRFEHLDTSAEVPHFCAQVVYLRLESFAHRFVSGYGSDERTSAARRLKNPLVLQGPDRRVGRHFRNGVVLGQSAKRGHLGPKPKLSGPNALAQVSGDLHVSRARVLLIEWHGSSVPKGTIRAPEQEAIDPITLGCHHGTMMRLIKSGSRGQHSAAQLAVAWSGSQRIGGRL